MRIIQNHSRDPKKLANVIFLLFCVSVYCRGESPVKIINAQSQIEKIVGYVRNFYAAYSRYPESISDLIENKPSKYDYDTARIFKQNSDMGYMVTYVLDEYKQIFEISLEVENKKYYYRSDNDTFYFYRNNELIREYKIR